MVQHLNTNLMAPNEHVSANKIVQYDILNSQDPSSRFDDLSMSDCELTKATEGHLAKDLQQHTAAQSKLMPESHVQRRLREHC